MSKIKLQNVNSMNHGIANGPMDGELDLGESGILDDSGMMDDSGNVPQIYDGYEYFQVVVEDAIFIRYVVMWNSGNLTGNNIASVKMICSDDGNVERIEYKGSVETENIPPIQTKSRKRHGDLMEYVGYATINGTEMMSQRILQKQEDS